LTEETSVALLEQKLSQAELRILKHRAEIQRLEEVSLRASISLGTEKEQLSANLGAAQVLKELIEELRRK